MRHWAELPDWLSKMCSPYAYPIPNHKLRTPPLPRDLEYMGMGDGKVHDDWTHEWNWDAWRPRWDRSDDLTLIYPTHPHCHYAKEREVKPWKQREHGKLRLPTGFS